MKCPHCQSKDTKKVPTRDPNWELGFQLCNSCGHQEHWMAFCDPPLNFNFLSGRAKVVIE